jgi:hypothetical protein
MKNNIIHSSFMNAKYFSNICLEKALGIKASYFKNLILGKFALGISGPFNYGHSAMSLLVRMIIAGGIPSKIFQKIVDADTIPMTGLETRGARANEGFQNKMVDKTRVNFPVFRQSYSRIAIRIWVRLKNLLGLAFKYGSRAISFAKAGPSPVGPHPSLVRNVIPFKPRNSFPNLINWGKMIITHGADLLTGLAVWGGPEWRVVRYPARSFLYHGFGQNARERCQNEELSHCEIVPLRLARR